jgi:peptidoglycan/xylan/chitin deacetylase (PgdA/CDA1 family)
MSTNRGRGRLVAVTFDDGYADNLEEALPVLEEFGVPATVFVSTNGIDSSREFWWDELEALLLGPHRLPEELSCRIGDKRFHASLAHDEASAMDPPAHSEWSVRDGEPPPTPRHGAYVDLLAAFRNLEAEARAGALDALHAWAERVPVARGTHRPLTSGGLRELAASDHIEIGAHSMSHPALSGISPKQRWTEIAGSRRELEALVGPIRHFAYPFGDWRGSKRLVRRAGFASACVTASRRRRRVDRYRLPRCYVGNWEEEAFIENLGRWGTTG